jgi:hypothetical protein
MRVVLTVIALFAAAAVAALAAGNAKWRRNTAQLVDRLTDTAALQGHHAALDQLPPPAARYLRRVLGHPEHRVRSAVATQQAEFFINGAWRPLTATQHFTTAPPGFVWDARIEMAPLVPAFVRDAYVAGRGSMQAAVYGLYSIVDLAGTPELNSGALQRFLGEAVWFPTALLPSDSVRWSPRDHSSSVVTLTDHGTKVSLVFEFDGNDDVMRISGDRYKETNGSYVIKPWLIQCFEHRERSGMRIPTSCEVSWTGPGGAEPYWRGRITAIDYTLWP